MNGYISGYLVLLFLVSSSVNVPASGTDQEENNAESDEAVATADKIQPYSENPWYWQYRGEPIVLIGGTGTDNLFQWTGERLTDHLDLLVSVGGNYARNTMSDRSEGDVYAFMEIDDGVYDLDQWNEEYWDRLEFFLNETQERGIIVQLTLWDQFDLHSEHPWLSNINLNFDPSSEDAETGNGEEVFHEFSRTDFYRSVEDEDEDESFLHYQQKYIDRLLSNTLSYGNILYNINNESSEGKIWENYWAQYIIQAGQEAGRVVYVTSMQFDPSTSVRHALTYPELYSFVEISQNNQDSRGGRGAAHWENIIDWRKKIASHHAGPMPMNNEKVYGSYDGRNYSSGTGQEAESRFWKNIFGGAASSRFHRDEGHWGIGLQERAQININAMSMFLDEFDIFSSAPHNDLLSSYVTLRTSMEAYCLASIGKQYAIYFPVGRFTIDLDPWVYADQVRVRWLDIDNAEWSEEEIMDVKWEGSFNEWGDRGTIRLTTPGNSPYLVLLEVMS